MSVRMRLRREGKKKQPHYRIVVANKTAPRDGRFVEDLGFYQPLANPSAIRLDHERALYWLQQGAQPSDAVRNLLRIEGVWQQFKPDEADAGAARRQRREAKRAAKEAGRGSSTPAASETAEASPEAAEASDESDA